MRGSGGRTRPQRVLLLLAILLVMLAVVKGRASVRQTEQHDPLVVRIRRRVMAELGLTHSPVKNATDAEMETVLREYRRLQAGQDLLPHLQRADAHTRHSENKLEVVATVTHYGRSRKRRSLQRRGSGKRSSERAAVQFAPERGRLGAHHYVTGGELRVLVRRGSSSSSGRGRLLVFSRSAEGRQQLASRRLLPTDRGWVTLDAAALAQQWRQRPDQALKVQLVCRGCGRRRLAKVRRSRRAPRLTVTYRRVGRARRSAGAGRHDFLRHLTKVKGAPRNCTRGNKRRCCRHKMYVNFAELGGLDFIIEPTGFSAYYCRGKCPASYNVANDHALLQSWVHQRRRKGNKRLPKTRPPCCAPSRLSALTIVHLDDNGKPKITYWENVVAEECKCS